MSTYNYESFDWAAEEPHFEAFRNSLHVGERAPKATFEDLETGQAIELQSLYRDGFALLEFGSFT